MKILYWNARGIGNLDTRLVLKNLCLQHRPHILFISEPKISFAQFPGDFLRPLNLKRFALNFRRQGIPNLWGFCDIDIDPTIIQLSEQHVALSLSFDHRTCYIAAVYANTSHVVRRQLWAELSLLFSNFVGPWSVIGDYNAVLGAHEKYGRCPPNKTSCDEFTNWTNHNQLIHLDTIGNQLTWSNARGGSAYAALRLDRVICNSLWIDSWKTVSCCTLPKNQSDHHPLLFTSESEVQTFPSSFKFQRMWLLHDDCKRVVSDHWKMNVVGCPMFILKTKLKLLKPILKAWNKEVFGDVHTKVANAVALVNSIQQIINDSGYTDALGDEEKLAQIHLDEALRIQEHFWRDKSRSKWFIEGDRNTTYFHKLTKTRHASSRLVRLKVGDNYITDTNDMEQHVLDFYHDLFGSDNHCVPTDIVERTIPNLVTAADNDLLTRVPSFDEVKQAVFNMDGSSSPGPDGFGGCFFQHFWDVVGPDVVASVTQFFRQGWILPNLNSSHVVLIPKFPGAETIENFRPIAMVNFQFKIITKILADRLAVIAPKIVSEHQRGFIKDRHIYECIGIASEAINLLDKKSFGGNMAMKIDIKKAFDTLDWGFLLRVLKSFGFNSVFCDWISTILQSAKLSFLVNGKAVGFFNCSRGVRQGDPLSPLLFCIAEEVLSRYLSSLVNNNKLSCITSGRTTLPSHSFFADDLMIFCKATMRNARLIHDLLDEYGDNSGQRVSPNKSKLFGGSINTTRLHSLSHALGFSTGTVPFDYLGVPIFKGKPKRIHLQAIADRVKHQLASWKGHSLSLMGRVQLVQSVIHGMLLYSFRIYSWPRSLIKHLDSCIRNFVWSGNIDTKKLVTLSWDKVCSPISSGGLGLRRLKDMNKAGCIKLLWELIKSGKQWATTLRSRFFRNSSPITHAVSSSIWSSLKGYLPLLHDHSIWRVGDGTAISFWTDNWLGYKLQDSIDGPIPDSILHLMTSKVADVVHNQAWTLPEVFRQNYPMIAADIQSTPLSCNAEPDDLVWIDSTSGELTFKDAYLCGLPTPMAAGWAKIIWRLFIPPARSLVTWRIMHNVIATDDNLVKRGFPMVSCCSLCGRNYETAEHLFLRCPYTTQYWNWFSILIGKAIDVSNFNALLGMCSRGWSPQVRDLIIATVINIFWLIWKCRNNIRFNDVYPNFPRDLIYLKSLIYQAATHSKGHMFSSIHEFSIIKHFGVVCHPPPPPSIRQVNWVRPPYNWIKCNTDGASRGSPGASACGGIFRDHTGNFLGAFSANIGVATSLFAEIYAAIYAIEFACTRGWNNLWLECDSLLLVQAFSNSHLVPWKLKTKWKNCLHHIRNFRFRFSHIYREGNICADRLANAGFFVDGVVWWEQLPSCSRDSFSRDRVGLPNYRFR
jgi:ribonuclease HI